MMHILGVAIFLGAFALSMAVVFWMLSANSAKIFAALFSEHGAECQPSPALLPAYTPRNRFSVTFPGIPRDSRPVTQRLAA